MQRKLRVCSAHKCIPCFGAKSPLRSTDLQRTRFHAAPYNADSTNLLEFGAGNRHGTVFAPMEFYIKRKLRVCSAQKCNPCFGAKSLLRRTDLQRTLFNSAPYRADSTNLSEYGAGYRHGTVFASMECLYQKETKGMQCQKMKSLFRCKKPTSQYGLAKNPV